MLNYGNYNYWKICGLIGEHYKEMMSHYEEYDNLFCKLLIVIQGSLSVLLGIIGLSGILGEISQNNKNILIFTDELLGTVR